MVGETSRRLASKVRLRDTSPITGWVPTVGRCFNSKKKSLVPYGFFFGLECERRRLEGNQRRLKGNRWRLEGNRRRLEGYQQRLEAIICTQPCRTAAINLAKHICTQVPNCKQLIGWYLH